MDRFIELTDALRHVPMLINASTIGYVSTNDKVKQETIILPIRNPSNAVIVSESYKQVRDAILTAEDCDKRRLDLVNEMIKDSRITPNEARIIMGLNPM